MSWMQNCVLDALCGHELLEVKLCSGCPLGDELLEVIVPFTGRGGRGILNLYLKPASGIRWLSKELC